MPQNTIYLIDGTSICYRAFFAIRLSNSSGFPTGAIYGFYQTLKKILAKYKPEHIGICFDVSKKTFRHEKFKEYKIQRPPMPDPLKQQIPVIKKLINFTGIKLIEKEGFEADDVIATLSKKALEDKFSVVIISSDKDMYQLLESEKIKVYDASTEDLLSEEDFKERFGFNAHSIVDYLSLAGDSVDNVPGAKGIGKVGASKLISQFETIENIFDNLDKIPEKTKNILLSEKENIFLSKELVTLHMCEINMNWPDLKIKEQNNEQIYKLFRELEFKSLLKDIPAPSVNLKIDIKEKETADAKDIIADTTMIFYTEGDSTYVLSADKKCIYKYKLKVMADILSDKNIKKVSYDFKSQMFNSGLRIENAWFDVKIAAYLLDSSRADYDLNNLVCEYLGEFLSDIPADTAPYFISRLYETFYPKLKESELEKLFFEVEMPLLYVLYGMRENGIKVDVNVLNVLLQEVDQKLESVKSKIFVISGKEFNLNSPKQLSAVLFEDLKIHPLKKTKTGYSTGEDVLEKLASKHDIAKLILEYRELNKLKTTYILPLIEIVKLNQEKLHAQFHQTVTQTGRLSSSSPNLQSIPAKGVFSAKLRSAFVPSYNDGIILCADYSQIELRILAYFSKDEKLKEAFDKKTDIHRYTSSLLFNKPESEVSESERNRAKTVNFAIIYGMSAYGLSRELNVGVIEAENFINDYFNRYPKVKDYIQEIYNQAQVKGYVTTILGRRRYLPDFKSSNIQLKEFASRQAVNSPIQGSSADLIKVAMVKIDREFKKNNLKSKLVMQIHDELVFDVHPDEIDRIKEIVKRNMEESIKLNVPIEVKIKTGKNWGEVQ